MRENGDNCNLTTIKKNREKEREGIVLINGQSHLELKKLLK